MDSSACGNCNNSNCGDCGFLLKMQWIKRNRMDLVCCCFSIFIFFLNKAILIRSSSGISGYFFKCYLNDLMAPICVLAMSSVILRCAGYEMEKFRIILLIGVFASLVWEFVIPLIKTSSVTDPNDLICYFVGTMAYYGIKRLQLNNDSVRGDQL